MNVLHAGKTALQGRKNGCLARNGAEQEVLQPAADNSMKDWALAVRYGVDLHNMAVGALTVILRKLAERPLWLACARDEMPLDHDLGVGRNAHLVGSASDDRERRPAQRTRDLKFVMADRNDRLRGKKCSGVDA